MIILKRVSDDPYICVTDIYDAQGGERGEEGAERVDQRGGRLCDPEFVNYGR